MKYLFLFMFIAMVSCKSSNTDTATPVTPLHGTGLKHNALADIEAIPEEEFDDSLFVDPGSSIIGVKNLRSNTSLPTSFALDGPPIISQGNTGKCGVFSSAYYIIGLYNGVTSSAQNYDKVGSTDFAYSQYKKVAGDACGGEGGVVMYPQGNTIGLVDALQKYGTTTWNQMPFVENNNCGVITDQLLSQAAANKISQYRRIDKNDYSNPRELKSFIYAGYPLWIGIDVDNNWQNIGTNVWKSSNGSLGGHAMVVVGWDDAKQAYKIANSWGTSWGDNGFGWVDYTYFTKLLDQANGEITVLHPNPSQMAVFSTLSPGSCGRANWGELLVTNNRSEQVSIEITGANNYANKKTDPTEANGTQNYSGIPQGDISIKVYNLDKSKLINTYNITITKCTQSLITIN